ncbi:MAG: uridine kinase [Thiocapsa sp.]|nr:uridine kinase [Thiocapsa sp.]QVL47488.1 MAG: uridine kinase [Thiocapsa sp.]
MDLEIRHGDELKRTEPCLIGIAGGSGSGKTTFARLLHEKLGDEHCAILYQDAYYRDQSLAFARDDGQVNFDHPDAVDFDLLTRHLARVKAGQAIPVPVYDYVTHCRLDRTETLQARPWIIVEGILVLSDPVLREHLDVTVFIETPEAVRLARRRVRDARERGRDAASVERQFHAQVKPMHDAYVEPSRCYADRVYSGEGALDAPVRDLMAWLGLAG